MSIIEFTTIKLLQKQNSNVISQKINSNQNNSSNEENLSDQPKKGI
ncbi:14036_t:CDS:1, partial [Dentiscutata erythropus]